jgi:hypothetical protein
LDYEVRVKGAATAGLDIDLASRQFAKVFKTEVEKAHKIITSGKVVSLRKNLSLERAEKIHAVLTKIGLRAVIHPAPIKGAELSLVAEPELDKPTELSLAPAPELDTPSVPQQARAVQSPSSSNTDSPTTDSTAINIAKKQIKEADPEIEVKYDDELPEVNVVPIGNGFTWIAAGFRLMKQHPLAWILASAAAIFINAGVGLIPVVGPFLSLALWPVLFGGLMVGAHKQAKGQPFSGFSFLNGLSAQPIQLVLVGAAYLVFYGLLIGLMTGTFILMGDDVGTVTLFIITWSASFPPMMILFFAPTLVAVNNISAYQACKLSLMGGLRNALPFMLFCIGLIVILLLGVLVVGVGLLVSMPIAIASMYAAYCDIFD